MILGHVGCDHSASSVDDTIVTAVGTFFQVFRAKERIDEELQKRFGPEIIQEAKEVKKDEKSWQYVYLDSVCWLSFDTVIYSSTVRQRGVHRYVLEEF